MMGQVVLVMVMGWEPPAARGGIDPELSSTDEPVTVLVVEAYACQVTNCVPPLAPLLVSVKLRSLPLQEGSRCQM